MFNHLSFLMSLSFLGSLFMCSFSSILSAVVLIFSTLLLLMIMYWNMINAVPLYLFSLFMIGGLYVLIGFVMMADAQDLNMMLSESSTKELLWSFMMILSGLTLNDKFFYNSNLPSIEFSPVNLQGWMNWGILAGNFIFMMIMLFLFLFIIHMMMKSSWGSGGFVTFKN